MARNGDTAMCTLVVAAVCSRPERIRNDKRFDLIGADPAHDFDTPSAAYFRRCFEAAFFRGLRFPSGAAAVFSEPFRFPPGLALTAMSRPNISDRSSPPR